jgi:tetratricopeptide (TPR) repeat protein
MDSPQTTPVTAAKPADSAAAPSTQTGQWGMFIFGSVAILVMVGAISLLLFKYDWFYLIVLVVLLASYFPLSYYSFQQSRAETRKRRIKSDSKLLGLTNEAELESIYSEIYAPQQYAIYISIAVVATLLGFGLYYYAGRLAPDENLGGVISTKEMKIMFYSFLGAYVFSIYYVYRRYVTMDLQPNIYLYIAARIFTVQAIALVATQFLGSNEPTNMTAVMIPIVAFLIGYIPDTGIRWLSSLASRTMGQWMDRDEQPLSAVNGISLWHETRLRESGIDNVQNLAAADVRELLLNSRFSTQQLMHWIDQAILMTNLPDKYKQLRTHGIVTISALNSNLTIDPASLPLPTTALDNIPPVTLNELKAVNNAVDTGPNFYYVTQYWAAIKKLRVAEFRQNLETILTEQNAQTTAGKLLNDVLAEQMAQMIEEFKLTPDDFLAQYKNQPKQLVNVGSAYIERGEYKIAIDMLNQAITLDGQNAAAYRARGSAWSLLDDYPQALADFDRAKELDPKDPITFNSLGSAYLRQNDFDKAIEAYKEAIRLNPEYSSAYFNLGAVYNLLSQYDEALSNFSQAIRFAKERYQAYLERGAIYMRQGRFQEAVGDFSMAIKYQRNNARSYNDRAIAYMQLKEYWRAVYDLETAIDIDPYTAAYHFHRAQAYWQLEEIDETIKNCTNAIQINSNQPAAYKLRARANERAGRLLEAMTDIDRYISFNPPDADKAIENRQKLLKLQAAQSTPAPEE